MYDEAVQNIEDAVHRVEQIARLPARQSMMVGLTMLHDHPHLPSTPLDASSFPCDTIPFAKNKRFFGRQDILQEIEEQLCDSERGLSSVAIYGLAGVGKTQIALEYAYKAQAVVDAVLWIPAESDLALQQGLGHVACVLKLQGADPDAHQNNTVLLMNWLKKTSEFFQRLFQSLDVVLT
jgi:hypothetical protein